MIFFRSGFNKKVLFVLKIINQINKLCMIEILFFSKLIKGPQYTKSE